MHFESFISQSTDPINLFTTWIQEHHLAGIIRADHIGYKCASTEEFESLREMWESHAAFIYQSIISKRRIAIIKLITPVETSCGPISFLELSDQKPDGSQKSGFDHLEVFPVGMLVEEFVHILESKSIAVEKVERPHHTTYDIVLSDSFKVRIEEEPLIEKIVREEVLLLT